MKELYKSTTKPLDLSDVIVEPIEHVDKCKLTLAEREMYEQKGIEAIKENKFAVVTMAGGQGTRLGHSGPKGTFDLGLDSHKSIFEILCDTMKEALEKYGAVIPWYIMTSRENNDDTVNFFEANNYFGYPKEAIRFFKQGELPMIDVNGKILLDENGMVKEASNGHGGTLESMDKKKVIEELKNNMFRYLWNGDFFIHQLHINHKYIFHIEPNLEPLSNFGYFFILNFLITIHNNNNLLMHRRL